MEEELAPGLGEGQIAQLVEDDEVEARQLIGEPPLPTAAHLGVEPVDEIDHVVEAAAGNVRKGTAVTFEVIEGKTPKLSEVFEHYVDPATLQFNKTRTTVKLGGFGRTLVSRSEARRIVAGLSKFAHATIDFSAVDVVDKAFATRSFGSSLTAIREFISNRSG